MTHPIATYVFFPSPEIQQNYRSYDKLKKLYGKIGDIANSFISLVFFYESYQFMESLCAFVKNLFDFKLENK